MDLLALLDKNLDDHARDINADRDILPARSTKPEPAIILTDVGRDGGSTIGSAVGPGRLHSTTRLMAKTKPATATIGKTYLTIITIDLPHISQNIFIITCNIT